MKTYTTRAQIQDDIEKMSFDEDSFDNLHDLATFYVKSKNYYGCLEILIRIEEIHGATSHSHLHKALCYYNLGCIHDAISSLEQSLDLDENNEQSKLLLCRLKQKLDNLRNYTMQLYG